MNFVFDIDGTLCFDGKAIDDVIVQALHQLREQGHEVTFASARPIRDLLPVVPEGFKLGKLVGGNGCFTSNNGEISTLHFTDDLRKQLQDLVNEYQLTYLADSDWDYAYTGSKDHPIYRNINQSASKNYQVGELDKICKLVLFNPTEPVISALNQLSVCITPYKNENAIDISPVGVNKVSGLHQLSIKDFIAFGNDSNDQCLFKQARFSVCVGENEVKQFATMNISKEKVAQTIIQLGQQFT